MYPYNENEMMLIQPPNTKFQLRHFIGTVIFYSYLWK